MYYFLHSRRVSGSASLVNDTIYTLCTQFTPRVSSQDLLETYIYDHMFAVLHIAARDQVMRGELDTDVTAMR